MLGDTVPENVRAELATLIYYPNEKLPQLKARCARRGGAGTVVQRDAAAAHRYLPPGVLQAYPGTCAQLPAASWAYILDELLHAHFEDHNKDSSTMARSWAALSKMAARTAFIVRLCELIKRLAVDKLHIVGDLFDRGPRPDHPGPAHAPPQCGYPVGQPRRCVDGCRAGSPICICTVLKTTLAYHNHGMMEDCYGINLRHLQRMAEQFYGNDDLTIWMPHTDAARGPYTTECCTAVLSCTRPSPS